MTRNRQLQALLVFITITLMALVILMVRNVIPVWSIFAHEIVRQGVFGISFVAFCYQVGLWPRIHCQENTNT